MRRMTVICGAVLLLNATLSGQHPKSSADLGTAGAGQSTSDYRLGSGDLLELRVFGVPDLDQSARVSGRGDVSLPLIGEVPVAGKTVAEAEQMVAARLISMKFVRNPQVSVAVREFRSQAVYVLGAVNNPGQYVVSQRTTLLDALSLAGGLDPEAAGEFILVRKSPPGAVAKPDDLDARTRPVIRVSIKSLLDEGDLSMNVPLAGGDVVHVPKTTVQLFYVVGAVNQPGAFEFPPNRSELLISHAIVRAGGPTRTAKASAGLLVRHQDGQRFDDAVDFQAILKGKKPDLVVGPDDIVFIPDSTMKTLAQGLVQTIPFAATNAVFWSIFASGQ